MLTAVVVTGSLGRSEATDSSDADWLLLVDGREGINSMFFDDHPVLKDLIRSYGVF
jgi:predicted nucleotidyltransferase